MKKIKLLIVTIFTLLCSSTNIEAYAETVSTAPNGCETPTVKYDSECPTNYYSSLSGKKKDDLLESLATLTFNNHKYYNTYGELRGSNCYSDADHFRSRIDYQQLALAGILKAAASIPEAAVLFHLRITLLQCVGQAP